MYSKISREKPSHQLKEKNEKAEYHSWSLSLPTTAAEKFWKKDESFNSGRGALKLFLNIKNAFMIAPLISSSFAL